MAEHGLTQIETSEFVGDAIIVGETNRCKCGKVGCPELLKILQKGAFAITSADELLG